MKTIHRVLYAVADPGDSTIRIVTDPADPGSGVDAVSYTADRDAPVALTGIRRALADGGYDIVGAATVDAARVTVAVIPADWSDEAAPS
ncbi:MAG: hypothetical protein ACRDSN_15940 [Pseudonocardiaceae bacterium]